LLQLLPKPRWSAVLATAALGAVTVTMADLVAVTVTMADLGAVTVTMAALGAVTMALLPCQPILDLRQPLMQMKIMFLRRGVIEWMIEIATMIVAAATDLTTVVALEVHVAMTGMEVEAVGDTVTTGEGTVIAEALTTGMDVEAMRKQDRQAVVSTTFSSLLLRFRLIIF
jgi:hypothetical protein